MRHRRNAVFGTANDYSRLDRNQKAKILYVAEQRERASKQRRKRDGIIGQSGLFLLRILLFQFHNCQTGRCDPSYDTMQKVSGFCRQTIAKAIQKLELAGILRVIRRMVRVRTPEGVFLRQISNLYAFPAESKKSTPTTPSLNSPMSLDPELAAVMERIRQGIIKRQEQAKQSKIVAHNMIE